MYPNAQREKATTRIEKALRLAVAIFAHTLELAVVLCITLGTGSELEVGEFTIMVFRSVFMNTGKVSRRVKT